MGSLYDDIPGGPELLAWFGEGTPSFHDAEICGLGLNRSGPSYLRVHWWRRVQSAPRQGNEVVVTFRLGDITDLRLEGFSPQNVIGELTLRRVPVSPEIGAFSGHEPVMAWEIALEPCYGLHGSIVARQVEITIVSGAPEDVTSAAR